jgi:Rod binding domain-containing protein
MKIGPLTPTSTFGLGEGAASREAEGKDALAKTAEMQPGKVDGKGAIDPEKLRLAREFEQIFIRKMLSSLEKTGQKDGAAGATGGGSAYGGMVVSALAEAVSKGGGVGLAEVIARAASQPAGTAGPKVPSTDELQTAVANATRGPHTGGEPGADPSRVSPESRRVTNSHPPNPTTYSPPGAAIKINEIK